ncbi:RloB family protein [Enterobacter sp. WCHEn090032]|uniref:RloB family protein n=1 Tax=Enterobacter sp. WCHEn090032 TaxID=2497435 RepID=UPI000F8648E9|nr:RloB family protein [Enterobacter sp. WCHEn090032]RTN95697.1 RloB domain-containing protein [Enterobacter sp. WCHEn090032]
MANKSRKLERRLHIICEGAKTEPMYLQGYIDEFASEKARLISIPDVKYNTPIALVRAAIRLKESDATTDEDEIWVVYDREAVSKYPHTLHREAWELAHSQSINVVLSNICFELWLLQHFSFNSAPYSCFDDLKKNSSLKADLLKIGIKNYDKADKKLYGKIKKGIPNARARAKALNKQSFAAAPLNANKPFQLSCYTNVNELLDAIDEFTP